MGSKNGYTIENGYIEAFGKKYKILFINKDVDNVHYVCSYDEAK